MESHQAADALTESIRHARVIGVGRARAVALRALIPADASSAAGIATPTATVWIASAIALATILRTERLNLNRITQMKISNTALSTAHNPESDVVAHD